MSARNNPVMLDLETLGVSPNSVILAIGAVKFDPDKMEITDKFYQVVSTQSCVERGFEINPQTVEWWESKEPAAKIVLEQARDPMQSVSITTALIDFAGFATEWSQVWGNGNDFDNAMLQEAYRKCGMEQPWKFWNNRCYRTMKNMFPSVKMRRVGTHHNAQDDATSQANHLMEILKVMRGE